MADGGQINLMIAVLVGVQNYSRFLNISKKIREDNGVHNSGDPEDPRPTEGTRLCPGISAAAVQKGQPTADANRRRRLEAGGAGRIEARFGFGAL